MSNINKFLQGFSQAANVRILITGGKGMLGHAFFEQVTKYFPHCEVKAPGRDELDINNPEHLAHWADWLQGGWLVHCAAMVSAEGCVRQPKEASKVIVCGTQNIIELVKKTRARLFYPQSFLIYDGRENPIHENEQPRPLSFYGELKSQAEQLILNEISDPLIVRMAGFFGGEFRDKNFVGKIIPHLAGLIQKREKTCIMGNRIWQPTLTDDLALNSLVLMLAGKTGIYQMSCHGATTFADLGKAILEELNWTNDLEIKTVQIDQIFGNELDRRPNVAILSCERLRSDGFDLQRHWRDALKDYLARPYFNQFRDIEKVQNEYSRWL